MKVRGKLLQPAVHYFGGELAYAVVSVQVEGKDAAQTLAARPGADVSVHDGDCIGPSAEAARAEGQRKVAGLRQEIAKLRADVSRLEQSARSTGAVALRYLEVARGVAALARWAWTVAETEGSRFGLLEVD